MKKLFSLLLVSMLTCSMAWANYSLTVYKGTSTPETMDVADKAAWEAVLVNYPNAVAIIDGNVKANETFAKSTKNIIAHYYGTIPDSQVKYESYSCPNLVLVDLCNFATSNGVVDYDKAAATAFYSPVDFKATTGSYSRSLRGDFNSVCVPFEIDRSDFGTNEVLSYNCYVENENNAYFTYTDVNVSPGVAVILDLSAAKDWTVTFNKTKIKGTPVAGTAFAGVFVPTNYAGAYSVNTSLEGKFSPLSGNLYPFRACFSLSGDINVPQAAPRLVIMNADEATALDEANAATKAEKLLVNGQILLRKNGQLFDINGKMMK